MGRIPGTLPEVCQLPKHYALDIICQYHFLENVGENLCEKPHAMLTKDLHRVRIRQAFKALRCDILRGSKTRMCASQVEALLTKPGDLANLDPVSVRRFLGCILLRWLDDLAPAIGGHWPLALEIRRQRASESTTHAIPTTKKQLRRETLLETLAKAAEATIGKQPKEGQAA